ncbi:IS4/Tn5 family transposase DNA-binding protein, partial [Paracraurococcus lichenis]
MEDASSWAERQWGEVDLGDHRRTRRAVTVGAAMAAQPAAGLPGQMGSWAGAKAAYRLLERPEVTLEAVTGQHRGATREAASRARGPVLFVHDDTVIDLSSHWAMAGRGRIGDDRGRGLMAHGCLALRPGEVADEVLGLAALTAWARPDAVKAKGETRTERNARRTEADVWAEAVEAVGPAPEGATWVSVGDRGADVFSHLARARGIGWHVLVRVVQNRRLGEGDHLVDRLRSLAPMARRRILPRGDGGRGPRQETWAEVAWTQVEVQPARLRRDRSAP